MSLCTNARPEMGCRVSIRHLLVLFVKLIESCLQKDPKRRPNMEDLTQKHKKFFAKANEQPLAEMLRTLPALERRIPPKPSWSAMKGQEVADGADRAASGSWDFKIDEDVNDGLEDLPEFEAPG